MEEDEDGRKWKWTWKWRTYNLAEFPSFGFNHRGINVFEKEYTTFIHMGQAITSSQFYVYGRYVSTKTGYLKHVAQYTAKVQPCVYEPPSSTTSDGVSLSGLAVVVTGANSGIGLSVATYCAGKNATVYLLCRSAVRAGEAVESIKKAVGNPAADLRVVECDVGSMPSVRAAMAEVGRQQGGRPLHSVVCNAGVMNTKREVVDGLEQMLATHLVIGSYLLAKLADPLMDQKEGRVVFVSSGGMYNSKFPLLGDREFRAPHHIRRANGLRLREARAGAPRRAADVRLGREGRVLPPWLGGYPCGQRGVRREQEVAGADAQRVGGRRGHLPPCCLQQERASGRGVLS